MIKLKRITKLVWLIGILVIISSCIDNDLAEELVVYPDVFTIKKMINDEPSYGVAYYAFGNQFLRSATVTQPGGSGEKIELAQSPQSIFTLEKIPQDMEFLPYPPVSAEYVFQIVAESGGTVEDIDFLDPQDIEIPTIVKAEFSDNNKFFELGWTLVDNIDGYNIKFVNAEGLNIYNGSSLEPDKSSISINTLLGNWFEAPVAGEIYTISVIAFAYEDDANASNFGYNMQEISIGETEVNWLN